MVTEGSVEYVRSASHTSRERASNTLQSIIKSRLRGHSGSYEIYFGGHKEDHLTYDGQKDQYICSAEVKLGGDASLEDVFHDADAVREHPVGTR